MQLRSFLHIIAGADPKGGGPIAGITAHARHRAQRGVTTTVVSLDPPDCTFGAGQPYTLVPLGPGWGKYGYTGRLVPWLKLNANNFDAIIINGLWQYHAFGAWRALTALKKPYAVFTHGMLDPWFKRQYPLKHLKKWLYWPWADYWVVRDAGAALFTTEEERLLARQSFWLYKANEQVVGYGIDPPPPLPSEPDAVLAQTCPDLGSRPYLLFLSRIHRKKGCDLLLSAFSKIAPLYPSLQLVMAGPDDPHLPWLPELKALAHKTGIADRVHWPGMVQGDAKWVLLRQAEAFCLPSHQENFGIAVVESLAAGTPVLISNQVNIWREIECDGCGLVGDDTHAGTTELLARFLALTPESRIHLRQQAQKTFTIRFHIDISTTSVEQAVTRTVMP